MSATTDSEMSIKYDLENKKGISNLISIYTSLIELSIEEVEKKYEGYNYGTLKKRSCIFSSKYFNNYTK